MEEEGSRAFHDLSDFPSRLKLKRWSSRHLPPAKHLFTQVRMPFLASFSSWPLLIEVLFQSQGSHLICRILQSQWPSSLFFPLKRDCRSRFSSSYLLLNHQTVIVGNLTAFLSFRAATTILPTKTLERFGPRYPRGKPCHMVAMKVDFWVRLIWGLL